MAKVSELKERARAYEKEGEHERALHVYLHILKHLEGSPAIKGELPMYVKAGDLQIKLEDEAGAIASYEKAAAHYAKHGSAKSVIALASKVLRVDPMKADFHLVHTRALIDHGHIGAARDVLSDYADRSELEKTQEVLQALEGRNDESAKPLLEMILDSAERGERSNTEEAAARGVAQLGGLVTLDDPSASEEDHDEGEGYEDEYEEPEAKAKLDPDSMLETVEQASVIDVQPLDLGTPSSGEDLLIQHGTPPPLDDGPAPPEPIAPPEPESVARPPALEPVASSQPGSIHGDLMLEPDESAFASLPPERAPTRSRRPGAPKGPSGVLTRKPLRRGVGGRRPQKAGMPGWVWGAGIIVLGGGVAWGVTRGGGETAPTVPATADTTSRPQPVATLDTSSLGLTVDSGVGGPNNSLDSLGGGDSVLLDSIGALAAGPPGVAPAPATAGPAYVLDGSTIQEVEQYSDQGRSGWRSIQTLSSGEQVTVETTMANVSDPNEMAQGATNITSDGNGSVGTTRMDNLIVRVTGAVSEALMGDLLRLLVEQI